MARNRASVIGLAILVALLLMTVLPFLLAGDPNAQTLSQSLKPPSFSHLLGTDKLGRDVWSRIVYGAAPTLLGAFVVITISGVIGIPLGLIAGYYGGRTDSLIMRILDAVLAIPQLVSALAIVATFGAGFFQVMIAIGVGTIPVYARITRGQVLSEREQDYVLAAASMGADSRRILVRHILPNILSPLIVQGSLGIAFAILAEASLSFLGVGIKPPDPTWGGMLSEGLQLINRAPWLSIFPGIAIFITVLSINTIGDTLRDILDPRLRGSR